MIGYITIDGGTTNTRLRLIKDHSLVAEARLLMGAKDCTLGNAEYKRAITEQIKELLSRSGTDERDIRAVIVSGMLTSELGICHLPHLSAPVGIKELHDSMRCVDIGISSIPCYLIPGVKIQSEDISQLDMMRGEECEFIGIADKISPRSVCIMTGSHTKHIFSDDEGRISVFQTYLSGEMIAALSQSTILSKSVDLSISDFDGEALLSGFDSVRKSGINRTLFQTRIMDNMLNKSPRELYSFFLGAILCEEVLALADCERDICISGQRNIRKSMVYLIKNRLKLSVSEISDHDSELASAIGAIKIFEYKGD